jgi:hypothetical protein
MQQAWSTASDTDRTSLRGAPSTLARA